VEQARVSVAIGEFFERSSEQRFLGAVKFASLNGAGQQLEQGCPRDESRAVLVIGSRQSTEGVSKRL
jgi:ribosomal protein S12 methylthiotransferase accessory factor YcaO